MPPALASLTARFLAGLVDAVVAVALSVAALAALRGAGSTVTGVVSVLLITAYFILAHGFAGKGYTLGKAALRIRVVNREGGVLSLGESAARFVIAVGVGLPFVYIAVGFERGEPLAVTPAVLLGAPALCVVVVDSFLLLFNRATRQSLHDLVAGSFVVRRAHAGEVFPAAVPLWRGHYAWIVPACLASAAGFHVSYVWFRAVGPRSIELAKASLAVSRSPMVGRVVAGPGFLALDADTVWFVTVVADIKAAPTSEGEAEDFAKALACAIARAAPSALRGAELDVLASFENGFVGRLPVSVFDADTHLTAASCAGTKAKF